jgi:hypothetical protein
LSIRSRCPESFSIGAKPSFFAQWAFPQYNTHCLLFSDSERGDIIGAMQRNLLPSTDMDHREGTFNITPSNPNAKVSDDYLRL